MSSLKYGSTILSAPRLLSSASATMYGIGSVAATWQGAFSRAIPGEATGSELCSTMLPDSKGFRPAPRSITPPIGSCTVFNNFLELAAPCGLRGAAQVAPPPEVVSGHEEGGGGLSHSGAPRNSCTLGAIGGTAAASASVVSRKASRRARASTRRGRVGEALDGGLLSFCNRVFWFSAAGARECEAESLIELGLLELDVARWLAMLIPGKGLFS